MNLCAQRVSTEQRGVRVCECVERREGAPKHCAALALLAERAPPPFGCICLQAALDRRRRAQPGREHLPKMLASSTPPRRRPKLLQRLRVPCSRSMLSMQS